MAEAEAVAELVAEKRKLKKSLFRFDMIFFTVCAIVALDTIGQSSSFGAQAVFWLIVSAITFLIPYGLLTSELGSSFPSEGAVYDWVRLAYGHFWGAITAVMYWLSNPIWLGGTLAATAIAAMDALWGSHLTGNKVPEIIIGFFFIWIAVTMNILSLRYMKWVPNLGAILRISVLALFAILVVVSGVQHGFQGSITNGFFPTNAAVFVGVLGVLVFQWVGFEVQTNASEEMENPQRDVPRAVLASGLISFLGYAIPIAGVILILSTKQLTNVGSFVTGYQTVVSSALGGGAATVVNYVVGAIIVFSLLSSGTTWLMGADRAMAIGALAGSGPRRLGYFSARFGTPVPVNLLSGIIATIFMVLTFSITSGNLYSFFAVVLGLAISTTTFSYILVFPALITLRSKYAKVPRPYRVPGGQAGLWITMLLSEVYVVLATVFSLWPNICTTSGSCFGSSAVGQVSGLDRLPYELTVLITMGVLILIGILFWAVGRAHAVNVGPPQLQPQAMPAAGD